MFAAGCPRRTCIFIIMMHGVPHQEGRTSAILLSVSALISRRSRSVAWTPNSVHPQGLMETTRRTLPDTLASGMHRPSRTMNTKPRGELGPNSRSWRPFGAGRPEPCCAASRQHDRANEQATSCHGQCSTTPRWR